MLNLIRWMFGYVLFSATGNFPERLINLISRRGIILWNVKKEEQVFFACVRASDYKALRPYARKAGLLLRVKEKHGAPFILRKLKPRMGVVVGIVCFFVVIYTMSMFIWQIDVEGNQMIKSEDLLSEVKELGIREGALKNRANIQMVEQNLMAEFPQIAWVSINTKGSYATISVNERIIPPDIVPENEPCNVKASMDAQVFRMEVYEGSAMVNNGDAVVKGQLLVSGAVEDVFGGITLHHADAKIYANTKRELTETVAFEEEVEVLTEDMITRSSMKLFGVNLPLSLTPTPVGDYHKQCLKKDLTIAGARLPIKIYKQIFTKQVKESRTLDKEQAKQKALEKISERESEEFKDIKVLERNEVETINKENYTLKIEYYCEEDIAQKEALMME